VIVRTFAGTGMKREDLQLWQAEQLKNTVAPMQTYLHKLRCRMDTVGFAHTDPFYALVATAENAMHALFNELHFLVCDLRKRSSDHPQMKGRPPKR
jgi:hypothetical protein